MANSVDPDQTAPTGAVCSGSTLFASILNSSVILGNYLQQTTLSDDIFRCIFFLVLYGLRDWRNRRLERQLRLQQTTVTMCEFAFIFVRDDARYFMPTIQMKYQALFTQGFFFTHTFFFSFHFHMSGSYTYCTGVLVAIRAIGKRTKLINRTNRIYTDVL